MKSNVEWSPRWYLWDGGFLAIGRSTGTVPPHAHHAMQISIALDGVIRVAAADGEWRECRGAIVRPDVTHAFATEGALGAMLFVDPECVEARWLGALLNADVSVIPDARLDACVEALRTFTERPLEGLEAHELVRHCVRSLCAGAPPLRRIDPRIARVIAHAQASDDLRLSLEDAAKLVFLSPGRFGHLFTEHMGLPFRRYMLWRKLTRAIVSIGRGLNLGEAAHTAGFSDAAHLTRTFHQMFGMPPSVMLRGEFFEIAPPFELHVA